MAALYTDEDFPVPVAVILRELGHDVLTAKEAGEANLKYSDERVMDFARTTGRIVVTHNRKDFLRYRRVNPDHEGIIICTRDADKWGLAQRIHEVLVSAIEFKGELARVVRPSLRNRKNKSTE